MVHLERKLWKMEYKVTSLMIWSILFVFALIPTTQFFRKDSEASPNNLID